MAKLHVGRPMKPPKGFRTDLKLLGRNVRVRYVTSIRIGRGKLDGYIDTNKFEIIVACWGRHRQTVADSIWHELIHLILYYARTDHCEEAFINPEVEEGLTLTLEAGQGALLRDNTWLRETFNNGR